MDQALKNNPTIQASRLEEKYYQALKPSAVDIEKTALGFEYGKINSFATDNKFSVSQSIQFPTVYKRQLQVGQSLITQSELNTGSKTIDVRWEVKSTFYALLVLNEKRKLLLQADSLYQTYLQKTELRFKAGDVDVLERSTAESQRLQINSQLQILQTDYNTNLNKLRWLTGDNTVTAPLSQDIVYTLATLPDTGSLEQTPAISIQRNEVQLGRDQASLERSKLLPSLSLGYNNMSIVGWQKVSDAHEQYYNRNDRFSTISAAIDIPLFQKAQRSRIRASNILVTQREKELEGTKKRLQTEVLNAVQTYQQRRQQLSSYQTTMLTNASVLMNTATRRLQEGEIAYLDWVILTNQALQIRSDNFSLVEDAKEATILIEKLSIKKKQNRFK